MRKKSRVVKKIIRKLLETLKNITEIRDIKNLNKNRLNKNKISTNINNNFGRFENLNNLINDNRII